MPHRFVVHIQHEKSWNQHQQIGDEGKRRNARQSWLALSQRRFDG